MFKDFFKFRVLPRYELSILFPKMWHCKGEITYKHPPTSTSSLFPSPPKKCLRVAPPKKCSLKTRFPSPREEICVEIGLEWGTPPNFRTIFPAPFFLTIDPPQIWGSVHIPFFPKLGRGTEKFSSLTWHDMVSGGGDKNEHQNIHHISKKTTKFKCMFYLQKNRVSPPFLQQNCISFGFVRKKTWKVEFQTYEKPLVFGQTGIVELPKKDRERNGKRKRKLNHQFQQTDPPFGKGKR